MYDDLQRVQEPGLLRSPLRMLGGPEEGADRALPQATGALGEEGRRRRDVLEGDEAEARHRPGSDPRPRVLFLDEPTANLDPESAKTVRDFILDLKKEKRTIFINTHNLDEAGKVCDRVGILKTRLVAMGATKQLLESLWGRKTVIHLTKVDDAIVSAVKRLGPRSVQVGWQPNHRRRRPIRPMTTPDGRCHRGRRGSHPGRDRAAAVARGRLPEASEELRRDEALQGLDGRGERLRDVQEEEVHPLLADRASVRALGRASPGGLALAEER